jgi:outer membrane murein-binding lipoprotein Lpp
MRSTLLLLVISGAVLAGDANAPPPESLASMRKRLAELEAEVSKAEAKIKSMRSQIRDIQSEIDHAAVAKDKAFTKSADLFEGMPKESFPKAGPNGSVERARAEKWATENLYGKSISFEVEVLGTIDYSAGRGFGADLTTTLKSDRFLLGGGRGREPHAIFGERVKLGDAEYEVLVATKTGGFGNTKPGAIQGNRIQLQNLSEDDVFAIRRLKGEKASVRATIDAIAFPNESIYIPTDGNAKLERGNFLAVKDVSPIVIEVSGLSVNNIPRAK